MVLTRRWRRTLGTRRWFVQPGAGRCRSVRQALGRRVPLRVGRNLSLTSAEYIGSHRRPAWATDPHATA